MKYPLGSPAAMSAEPSLHPPEPTTSEPETVESILKEWDRRFWTLPECPMKEAIGAIFTILELQYREMTTPEPDQNQPAFPCQWIGHSHQTGEPSIREQFFGLSLRDYFAAKALEGMWASDAPGYSFDGDFMARANAAYQMADAMLAARQKGAAQ